jgi:hypothetical protein
MLAGTHTCPSKGDGNCCGVDSTVYPYPPEKSKLHQVCPSIIMQSVPLNTHQSYSTWFTQRVPQPCHHCCHKISQSRPCICKMPHEMPPSTHLQHMLPSWTMPTVSMSVSQLALPFLPLFQDAPPYPGLVYGTWLVPNISDNSSFASDPSYNIADEWPSSVNIIGNDESYTNSNIFCFGEFTDQHTGTMYNDLTGTFPFMSLKGSIFFLII